MNVFCRPYKIPWNNIAKIKFIYCSMKCVLISQLFVKYEFEVRRAGKKMSFLKRNGRNYEIIYIFVHMTLQFI